MKKFYVTVVVCLFLISGVFAQDRFWVGPATSSVWNDPANWSAVSNGAGGASVPNGTDFNAIFNSNAEVNLNIATANLSRLVVTNNSNVKVFTTQATTLTLNSVSPTDRALQIDAGSYLLDSTTGDFDFQTIFANNTLAIINGTWAFNCPANQLNSGPYFFLPTATGLTNHIDINGKVYVGNAGTPALTLGHVYIDFNAGSEYHLDGNKGIVPNAGYTATSNIRITGRTTTGPTFGGTRPLGNIIYNNPGQINVMSFNILNRVILGSLTIENTNGNSLTIFGNGNGATVQSSTNTINGNLVISGNSRVNVSNMTADTKTHTLVVNGNVDVSGGILNLQTYTGTTTKPTTLQVKGNIEHTGGIITADGNRTIGSEEIYIIEMAGTSPQTINSVSGIINNSNNSVTLRMNNPSGVTLLSPLTVGLLSFNSSNKGVLTTSASTILTINNRSAGTLPVNQPADNGYVDGPVRRRTANLGLYEIPVGKNGNLQMVEISPNTNEESFYIVEYFRQAFADLSVVPPLTAVSNQYFWQVQKESGSDASIRMFLEQAIPGATVNDALLPAKYNGSDWLNVKGTTGTSLVPGNSSSGFVTTDLQGTYGFYTIGYGAQSTLPVNLVSFNGKKLNGGKSQLNWTISSNARPERFEILRSTDGRNFTSIGSVNGLSSKFLYDFEDAGMLQGNNFYRLKMFDKDGSVNYSKIITLMNGSDGFYITSMLPTIVYDRARVNVSSSKRGSVQLVVSDINGRIVYQQIAAITAENQEIWLELRNLSKGAYHVTGYFNGNKSETLRFVKQ
jgi:hypothetical protein